MGTRHRTSIRKHNSRNCYTDGTIMMTGCVLSEELHIEYSVPLQEIFWCHDDFNLGWAVQYQYRHELPRR